MSDARKLSHMSTMRIAPMDAFEYQRFYDCGAMPERFWPEEIAKLQAEYADGSLTLRELEDCLDDLMGITLLEQANAR